MSVLLHAVVTGAALGVFDVDALVELDEMYYHQRSGYRDDSYNKRGLWQWERRFVDEFLEEGGRVLVTSAGGGREVLALEELGFDIAAFECNQELRDAGNDLLARSGARARIAPARRDECPNLGRFDAAVIGWGSYTLISGRRARVEFLRAVRAQVDDGGPVLLSFFTRTNDETGYAVVAKIANLIRRLRRASPIERGDTLSPNWTHAFTDDEIDDELAAAGLEPVVYRDRLQYAHAVTRA